MKIVDFLSYLYSLDIEISAEGEHLRINAPQGTLTSTLRSELVERKTEILDFLQQANKAVSATLPPIPRASRNGHLPLSFSQQRLWFLDQLEPDNPTYRLETIYSLNGPLNVTALEQAFNEIVRRHESLRTTFSFENEQPVQVIAPTLVLPVKIIELQHLPENEQEIEVRRLVTEATRQPFDLTQGPLLRVALLRLNTDNHILLLTMHHIVSDGWSMGILYRELSTLYDAYCTGMSSPFPELAIQYGDFATWQRGWLQKEKLDTHLDYWKKQLDGIPSIVELPADRPRSAAQTFRGSQRQMNLSNSLSEALKRFSQGEGVSLFMTLLAAFKVLLHRHIGQDDIVIGMPIANRNQPEVENLIGLFINTLVLRTDLSGNPAFQKLLAQVREAALGAYEHQDLPFEKLVEELQPERALNHTPLFQIMFNMLNLNDHELELRGLTVERWLPAELDSMFDLTLYVEESNAGIQLILVYNSDLFDSDRMVCLLQQFRYLLEQAVVAPDQPIQSYSLVTPEAYPLLPDPAASLPEPEQELVTDMILMWANRLPNQPAISQGERTWSYHELAECAITLGQVLQANGVKQGDVIGVHGPQSFGLIAGMVGIFLSGGVLLSLDHNLPHQRKQLMLQEAKAKCLIDVGDIPPEDKQRTEALAPDIFIVDPATGQVVGPEADPNLERISLPKLTPDDTAYIFFTSGTTGTPKGVMGCHKGLSHFLNWQRETFAIGPQDRSAQLTSLSFDVVLRDIFLPLTSGAALCLPKDIVALGPDDTIQWLEHENVSILHTVPSLAQYWLGNISAGATLSAMRWLFFAGEPLTEALIRQWRNAFPDSKGEFINLYGPTETTLAKCFYQVPSTILPGIQPVGRPLPQAQALVFDQNNQLCGIGEPGQIVLRTPFRTLGYINASEEYRRRFIKNPFSDDEDDLLYYTGDRGRYRPDGTLEILGRLDDQIKIRGVRAEPGEITAILSQHPAVKSCFVTARAKGQDQLQLVAYVVSTKQDEVTIAEFRAYLSKQLPAAMVPSVFVLLEYLPLTPNGKVDRQALPAPEEVKQEPQSYVAPRDELELQLTKIWEGILNVRPISVRDDFFDLGGHSLLAVRLFARLQKVFNKNLPLATLFQAPTIEQMGNLLRNEGWKPPWSSLVPIQPLGSKPPFFCVHAVGGNVLSLRGLAQHLGPDQPFYALQSQGLDGKQNPPTRVEEMAAYYIDEIRTVQAEGPYFLGGQSSGGLVAFEVAQQLKAQGQQIAILVLIDTFAPNNHKAPESTSIHSRANFHLRMVSHFGPNYILDRVKDRLKGSKFQLKSKVVKAVKGFYQNTGHPLPQNIRYAHVAGIIQQAARNYHPQTYDGGIILFRATNTFQAYLEDFQGVERGWDKLAANGIQTFDIPGAHNLEQEPYVGTLAEKLSTCLHETNLKITSDF